MEGDYALITKYLEEALQTDHRYQQAAHHATLPPGQLLRPLVLLSTGRMFGLPDDKILPCAATIELAHTASLILDDLPPFDNSDERRGRKSTHMAYDVPTALLAYNYLRERAERLIHKNPVGDAQTKLLILEEINQFALDLLQGEAEDLFWVPPESSKEMLERYALKSGTPFAGAAVIGGLLGGATPQKLDTLRNFGISLGKGYQLQDDLDDHYRDTMSYYILYGKASTEGAFREQKELALSFLAQLESDHDTSALEALTMKVLHAQ
ncbi:MAG: polyprenyl synthetase family protein [Nanoarchaeota archaeon]